MNYRYENYDGGELDPEVAAFLAVLGYGVLLYSISFRWLNLFPEEKELATKG